MLMQKRIDRNFMISLGACFGVNLNLKSLQMFVSLNMILKPNDGTIEFC